MCSLRPTPFAPTSTPEQLAMTTTTAPDRHLALSWSDHDEMRWMTVLTGIGLGAAAVLAVIGNAPFDLPRPTHAVGWVTPTCGLTRGATALARGDVALAWDFNPASLLVPLFALVGVARAAWGWATGRWLTVRVRPGRLGWAAIVVAVVLLAWNQQANADFVMHARI